MAQPAPKTITDLASGTPTPTDLGVFVDVATTSPTAHDDTGPVGTTKHFVFAALPISTAVQSALDGKADVSVLGSAAAHPATDFATAAQGLKADSALQPTGDGSALAGLTKAQVGLGSVDDTPDLAKPVSTATRDALDLKADDAGVVHRAGAETIAGAKTFTVPLVGSITGNAGTATDGVVTTGSYADPPWLASLAGTKIVGNIAGTAGGLSADIPESRVTGLVADLAGKATAAQGSKADSAVQSIALATPNLLFATPVTFAVAAGAAAGSLTLNAQAANTVLAGPATGPAAAPTMRLLVAADLPAHSHPVSQITATGTPSATTYLRGDGSWATPAGGGATLPATTAILKGNGSGGAVAATAGTDFAAVDGSGYLVLNGTRVLMRPGTDNLFAGSDVGNTTLAGTTNLGIGVATLAALTTGSKNVGLGPYSLQAVTTGGGNMAIGSEALRALTTGGSNTAIGETALRSLTTGGSNTAIGTSALYYCVSGNNNIGIGPNALVVVTGNNNIGIGIGAGTNPNNLTTGSDNVYIGSFSGPGVSAQLNCAGGIGSNAAAYASNTFWIGGTGAQYGVDVYAARSWRLADQSGAGTVRQKAYFKSSFVSNVDASFTAYGVLGATDSAGDRDGVKVQSDGTQALLGFFGSAAVARPSGDVLAGLAALNLVASPTIAVGVPADHKFDFPEGSAAVGTDQTTRAIVSRPTTCRKVFLYATTAPTGADLIVDILRSSDGGTTWASLWATTPANRPKLVAGSKSGTATAFDTTSLAEGDLLRFDVVQIGSAVAGSGVIGLLSTTAGNL